MVRAQAWYAKGSYAKALADLKHVTGKVPLDLPGLDLLARIRASCPDAALRDGKIAVESAIRACELTSWKQARCLDTLAAACAEAGDFAAAVNWQTKAIELEANPAQEADYRARLKLYQKKKPYRDAKP